MSTYKCPKGHESTESDYCSECGTKIQGISESVLATNPVTSTAPQTGKACAIEHCPDCTAPHEPDSGDFCEICGYNFITGAHGEIPLVSLRAEEQGNNGVGENNFLLANHQSSAIAQSIPIKPVALEAVVTIDPSLREEGSPPAPTDLAPITFQLDKEINLIGRRSDRRGIYPEISLDFDDAISHRHALLLRQPDGNFVLRDIGSSNGTKLNGVELAAMVDAPIKAGDEFTLGHWTRIIVKAATL